MGNNPFFNLYRRHLSLVELMIISVIVAIVMTILGQRFLGFDDDSKWVEVKQNIRSIEGALNLYYKDMGSYPTTLQGLSTLIQNPRLSRWGGPYLLQSSFIIDPWGTPYHYESDGSEYAISSSGKQTPSKFRNIVTH